MTGFAEHALQSLRAGWEKKRVKFFAEFSTGGTPPTKDSGSYVGDNPWATISDLGPRTLCETLSCINDQAAIDAAICPSVSGSLLFSFKLSVGQVSIAGIDMYTNEAIATFPPQEMFDIRWAYYAFPVFIPKNAEVNIYGAPLLNGQRIRDADVLVPPIQEQHWIAEFLDLETMRIDALLHEKRALLIRLDELRAGRMTDILLGRDLAMQPTGNVWVPHIPISWSIKKLKHIAQVRSGLTKGKTNDGKDTVELPYLRVANVQDGHIDLTHISTINVPAADVGRFSLQALDVLMNEGGDYDKVGRGAVWYGQIEPCLHQNHVFSMRLDDPEMAEWVSTMTRTAYAKFYFMNNAKQSTNLASISQKNIKEFPVVMPPREERTRRLAQLNKELANIANLEAHVRTELAAITELRSATITDAVLGRIDLTEFQSDTNVEEAA